MILDKQVIYLPKIGPKYKSLLQNLEIETVRDLIYHVPFRYDDFSEIKNIADLVEGETVTIEGSLEKIDNIFTKFGKKITKARVKDNTGYIDIIWFNQHYIKNNFNQGETYRFGGKVSTFANKLTMIAPEFEEVEKAGKTTSKLLPVYPQTEGVSSKWLRARINDVLSAVKQFDEFLPETILNKHKLFPLDNAIRQVHFPQSLETAKKARDRLGFDEVFLELMKVEQRKKLWNEGIQPYELELKKHTKKIQTFIKELPFKLTQSQETAVQEILEDMEIDKSMNRLLEGDVGTGKTVVAVIAAYLAILNKTKVLYLAPTEILAQQHFITFQKLLGSRVPELVLITGSTPKKVGSAKIIIGTHALFELKEPLEDVSLIIIDEQHRFGVEQRTKLIDSVNKQSGKRPNLLTMTATPIPRTLALTLFGDLSLSVLGKGPNENKKIYTRVIPDKLRKETYEWIKNKNEQTFIVCPLIEFSESESLANVKSAQVEYEYLKDTVFKDVPIGLLHGRMKSAEKNKVIEEFKNQKLQVLVATPVIEVGIDVPEATIMVIESAQRYGLASLHQLRGRVGRGEKPGFCFVFASDTAKSSYERLKHLETNQSGLALAQIDMKLRGQGDVFGTLQHGFKRFKIADETDLELIEKAKKAADQAFANLDIYPSLRDILKGDYEKHIGEN